MKVNLGCGRDVRLGYVNVDRLPHPGVIVADVEGEGLPFPSGSVDLILARHVLEHVVRFDKAIAECWRVLRPGGRLEAYVPYGFYGLENPYHVRVFTRRTVRQILAASNPDGVSTLEIAETWRLVSYRVRRKLTPWLHKPKVGFDPWPWIYEAELAFVLEKVA